MQPVFMKSDREEMVELLFTATNWRTGTNRGRAGVVFEGWAQADEFKADKCKILTSVRVVELEISSLCAPRVLYGGRAPRSEN